MKKFLIALLSIFTLAAVASGCGWGQGDSSSESSSSESSSNTSSDDSSSVPAEIVKYTFQVHASGVKLGESGLKVVVYSKDGETKATLLLDDSGKRTKNLTADEYTVCLENENGDKLYEAKTDLTGDQPVDLYLVNTPTSGAGKEQEQFQIGLGYYQTALTSADKIYYAFMPEKSGTYRISSIGNNDLALHLYAASEAYLNPDPIDSTDDVSETDLNFSYEFQVTPQDLTSMGENGDYKIYFSVSYAEKAAQKGDASVMILAEYVSDEYDELDPAPDIIYETVTLTKAEDVLYDENGNVVPFGEQEGTLTPIPYSAELVYNETDHYYHVGEKDGPLALMMFTKTPTRLFDQPFNKIANPDPNDPEDNANPATLHLTFVDEAAGKVTVKEYNALINEIYPSAVNSDGVYPLTEEMREFLYQFIVVAQNDINVQNVPQELRWKAPCYYYETESVESDRPDVSDWTGDVPTSGIGSAENPYKIGVGDYCAPFGSVSGIVYYTFEIETAGELIISTTDENATILLTVECQEPLYSETGDLIGKGEYKTNVIKGYVLTLQVSATDWTASKIPFSIAYKQAEQVDPTVENGTKESPFTLTLGETTAVNDGSAFFIYYKFTPTESGAYEITVADEDAMLYVKDGNKTVNKTYTGTFTVTLEAGKNYSFEVIKGLGEPFTVTFTFNKAA